MNQSIDVAQAVAISLSELAEQTQQPVPGAKFKAYLLRKFDDSDHPVRKALSQERFGAFLRDMQDRITLRFQYGSDFLAVPKGKEHFFSKSKIDKGFSIRKDLFRAFTFFGNTQLPYYDRQTDKVVPLEAEPEDTGRYVPIPSRTIEHEIELRKQFAAQMSDAKIADQLQRDLTVPQRELTNFTWTVRSNGYQKDWYVFRNSNVLKRIRDWANINDIEWNENWVEAREERYGNVINRQAEEPSQGIAISKLAEAISMLSDEDKRRISIPLDIVIRFMGQS